MAENYYTKEPENKLYQAGQTLVNKFGLMKNYFTFRPVFIGYGLKTGQGFYPGPKFFRWLPISYTRFRIVMYLSSRLRLHSKKFQSFKSESTFFKKVQRLR